MDQAPWDVTWPRFERAMLSETGDRIWLRRFRIDQAAPETWDIYDSATGSLMRILRNETGGEILAVGVDTALLLMRDEWDVERIELRPLIR